MNEQNPTAAAPRACTTIPVGSTEVLDALPLGTILRDVDETLWERTTDEWVCSVPWEMYTRSSVDLARRCQFDVVHLPAASPKPAAQAAIWAASCEALDAASPAARLAALQAAVEATVNDLQRAGLVPADYEYVPDTNVGELRILTGNLQLRAGMTGSLDTPAAHFLVTTSDDDDEQAATERTTTDLGAVRAWIMAWTVAALHRGAAA